MPRARRRAAGLSGSLRRRASSTKFEELQASDDQLLGRATYDGFAAWNNTTTIAGNVASEVAKLKDRCDGDILVAGSATLVAALREHDLVRLMVHRWCWLPAGQWCDPSCALAPPGGQ